MMERSKKKKQKIHLATLPSQTRSWWDRQHGPDKHYVKCKQMGPVTSDSEKRFFADNYIQYLKTTDDTEVDNDSSFAWA
jgi:hypothetical protein